jgi:hypothetical protein
MLLRRLWMLDVLRKVAERKLLSCVLFVSSLCLSYRLFSFYFFFLLFTYFYLFISFILYSHCLSFLLPFFCLHYFFPYSYLMTFSFSPSFISSFISYILSFFQPSSLISCFFNLLLSFCVSLLHSLLSSFFLIQ